MAASSDRAFLGTLVVADTSHDHDERVREMVTGYLPFEPEYALEALRHLRASGAVSPGAAFLDLGAGTGNIVATAAYAGLKGYGIELDAWLVERAHATFGSLRARGLLAPGALARIAAGNYFPRAYFEAHRQRRSIAATFEEALSPAAWTASPTTDPYAELGISLADVDVFFCYAWTQQVPSVWELFSRYARPDALLLTAAWQLPARAGLLRERLGLECLVDPELDGERWRADGYANKLPIYLVRKTGAVLVDETQTL